MSEFAQKGFLILAVATLVSCGNVGSGTGAGDGAGVPPAAKKNKGSELEEAQLGGTRAASSSFILIGGVGDR